jgi:hypothetical protein
MKPLIPLAFVLYVFVAAATQASTTVSPPSPTSADRITASVDVSTLCGNSATATVTGTNIRMDITFNNCVIGPPVGGTKAVAQFGPLPAGTYTLQVFTNDWFNPTNPPTLDSQVIFVVTPAVVPTLDAISIFILTSLLAGLGCIIIGKQH